MGLFKVKGRSMEPNFREYDIVLVTNIFRPAIDDVVVVKDPQTNHRLLKRITKIQGKRFFVEGDNYELSTDSRHFGFLSRKQIQAKVLKKF